MAHDFEYIDYCQSYAYGVGFTKISDKEHLRGLENSS